LLFFIPMRDRIKLDLFWTDGVEYYQNIDITPELFEKEYIRLCLDFKLLNKKNDLKSWIDVLPNLADLKGIILVYPTNQEFFETVCKVNSLHRLTLSSLKIHDLNSISQLQSLNRLTIESCHRIETVEPLLSLKNLEYLWIENCFNIKDLELIGELKQLKALRLWGNVFAPKNLKIDSLKPFRKLKNLKHLDICSSSVTDKSYEAILEMENLERFDITSSIKPSIVEELKSKHKNLKAGFFVDYDYKNKKFYPDKDWEIKNSN
jgi:hypothetical protein